MMDFPRHENAKWAQAVNAALAKYDEFRDKVLEEDAARGFPSLSGPAMAQLLAAGMEVKEQLIAANAKIYEEERDRLFREEELELKLAVGWAKLALAAYRQSLLNRLALEEADQEAAVKRTRADLERLNTETEARQADIITFRAAIEVEINHWRRLQIEAEQRNLEAEAALAGAQLATAEAKLETIDPIYEVIAAQELVLKAEERKAAALEKTIAAEKRVAEVKKAMIPAYLEKAAAREELAEATRTAAGVEEQRIRLGYRRLALKDAEEAAAKEIRQAELEHELAQEAYVRAEMVRRTTQDQYQTLLARHANAVQADILAQKLELDKAGVDFRISARLKRLINDVQADIGLLQREKENLWREFLARLAGIQTETIEKCQTIRSESVRVVRRSLISQSTRWHRKGVAGLPAMGGGLQSGGACPEAD